MKVVYRKATAFDLDAVESIYNHIHDAEEAGAITTGWIRGVYPQRSVAERSLERDDLYVAEIKEDGERFGQIAATAIINKLQVDVYADCNWAFTAPDDEVLVLHTLAVDPLQTRCGIGRGFVRYYEELADDMDCTVLRIDTNARNRTARKMYASLGFREADIVPTVFNGIPGVDLVLLEKKTGQDSRAN